MYTKDFEHNEIDGVEAVNINSENIIKLHTADICTASIKLGELRLSARGHNREKVLYNLKLELETLMLQIQHALKSNTVIEVDYLGEPVNTKLVELFNAAVLDKSEPRVEIATENFNKCLPFLTSINFIDAAVELGSTLKFTLILDADIVLMISKPLYPEDLGLKDNEVIVSKFHKRKLVYSQIETL